MVRPVALAVTGTEAAIVLLLLVPATTILGFSLAVAMLFVFSTGILKIRRRRATVPCRCFGASTTPLGIRHVIRNVALMLVAGAGVLADFAPDQAADLPGILVAAGVGIVLALLLVAFDDLIELFVASPASQSTRP
jgi:hypothetical protein